MSLQVIFLVVAVILFLVAAFGVESPKVGLVPLGLAFFAGSFIVPLV